MKPAVLALLLVMAAWPAYSVEPSGGHEPAQSGRETETRSAQRCQPAIGSRIVRRGPACEEHRRRYDQEQLRATGETDLARALQKLDPALSRRR